MNAGAMVAIMAAISKASNASGTIVHISEEAFVSLVSRSDSPLVIHAPGGFLSSKHKYLTTYKGFAFYTKSKAALALPSAAEIIEAERMWVPEM